MISSQADEVSKVFGTLQKVGKSGNYIAIGLDVTTNINSNIKNGEDIQKIITDATVDTASALGGVWLGGKAGAMVGSYFSPGVGTVVGFIVGIAYTGATDGLKINDKSLKVGAKNILNNTVDNIQEKIENYIKTNPQKVNKVVDFQIKATILPIPLPFN